MKWRELLLKVEDNVESDSLVLRLCGGRKRLLPAGSDVSLLMSLMSSEKRSAAVSQAVALFGGVFLKRARARSRV